MLLTEWRSNVHMQRLSIRYNLILKISVTFIWWLIINSCSFMNCFLQINKTSPIQSLVSPFSHYLFLNEQRNNKWLLINQHEVSSLQANHMQNIRKIHFKWWLINQVRGIPEMVWWVILICVEAQWVSSW